MMIDKFIYVKDEMSKNELISKGYHLIQENKSDNLYIFENKYDVKLEFDKSKFVQGNTLMF